MVLRAAGRRAQRRCTSSWPRCRRTCRPLLPARPRPARRRPARASTRACRRARASLARRRQRRCRHRRRVRRHAHWRPRRLRAPPRACPSRCCMRSERLPAPCAGGTPACALSDGAQLHARPVRRLRTGAARDLSACAGVPRNERHQPQLMRPESVLCRWLCLNRLYVRTGLGLHRPLHFVKEYIGFCTFCIHLS